MLINIFERLPFHFEKMGISHCMVERKLLNILWCRVTWRRGSFQNNHAEWVLYHKTPRCYPYQSNWIKSRQRLIYSALDSSLCLTRLVSTLCRCTPPQKEMKSCHCRWSVPLFITNSRLPLDNNKFRSYIIPCLPCPSTQESLPMHITHSPVPQVNEGQLRNGSICILANCIIAAGFLIVNEFSETRVWTK